MIPCNGEDGFLEELRLRLEELRLRLEKPLGSCQIHSPGEKPRCKVKLERCPRPGGVQELDLRVELLRPWKLFKLFTLAIFKFTLLVVWEKAVKL